MNRSLVAVLILCAETASGSEPWEESRRIGTAAREQGRYADARRDLDDELASVYEYLGESAAAERAYRDAVTIVDHRTDVTAGFRSTILGDFGLFRAHQGRFKEAGELLEAMLAASLKRLANGTSEPLT